MKKTQSESGIAQSVEALTLVELSAFCHVRQDWVVTLVAHGVLEPEGEGDDAWLFDPTNVARARKAQRLARDFELHAAGLALVLDLIEERDTLMRKLV